YPDSIVRGDRIYTASGLLTADAGATGGSDSLHRTVVYTSAGRMADALFAAALADTSALTVADVRLAGAFLRPEESMAALRAEVADGCIRAENFPKVSDIGCWAIAAWELYCVTGSRQWLKEAYDILTASIRSQWKQPSGRIAPLVCGQLPRIDNPADYYPEWMTAMDRYQTLALAVNVSQAAAHAVASRMAGELRLYAEREHQIPFSAMRSAINDRLWIPDEQRYGQYLYGVYYPVLSAVSDSRANALCVLDGIATAEMSEALVSAMPVYLDGVPDVCPQINPATGSYSPLTQALFALAAAKVRNPQAFVLGVASLMNMAVEGNLTSEWPAVVCKGFFGMDFTPDGIDFRPIVPAAFGGAKTLTGFRYRDAVFDIVMHGTGDRIATFAVDSVSLETPRLPATLEGHHRVDITLSGNDLPEPGVNIVERRDLLHVPRLRWSDDGRSVEIMDFDPEIRYSLFENGVMTQVLGSERYSLPPSGPSVTAIVPSLAGGLTGFSPRSHVYAPGQSEITILASSVIPRRPPLHLIRDRRIADGYIELAARHNTRITCYANIPADGEYFLTVGYSNGSQHDALRTLSINDRDVATLVCPSFHHDDWVTVRPSNTVVVSLQEGPNKIALTYIGGTMLLNRITLLKKVP
ncbi:MAG: hypothetical protein K2O20_03940, partial [Duncaniella sp.]|nr:hypothetical protein [Duncaniella sp.]